MGIKTGIGTEQGEVIFLNGWLARRVHRNVELDRRVQTVKAGHHRRQKVHSQHRRGQDAQGADHILRVGADGGIGLVNVLQDEPHAGQIGLSRLGQRHPVVGELAAGVLEVGQQRDQQVVAPLGHPPP